MNAWLWLNVVPLALWISPTYAEVLEGPAEPVPSVSIHAHAEPETDVVVGQLIRVYVELTTPTRFTSAPQYPELKVPGAIVLMPDQFGINFSNNQGGKSFVGQRQRYAVIPQRPGTVTIPAIAVQVGVDVDGKASDVMTVKSVPFTIVVVVPEAARGVHHLVAVPKLSVNEKYEPALERLKVGDAFTRSVTITADNTFTLALPATVFKPINGIRLYPAQPVLNDNANRGQYKGSRSDAATYALEQAGSFSIPEIAINWWDTDKETLETVELEARTFSVAPNPDAPVGTGTEPQQPSVWDTLTKHVARALIWLEEHVVLLTTLCGAVYLLLLALRNYGPRLRDRVKQLVHQIRLSEPYHYFLLQRAIWSGDDQRTIDAFWRWLDCFAPPGQVASVRTLARQAGSGEFVDHLNTWALRRYGGPRLGTLGGERRRFMDELKKLRDALLAKHKPAMSDDYGPLNPTGVLGGS